VNPAPVAPLEPETYRELVRAALREDIGAGDVTTSAALDPDRRARGTIVVKSRCVIAGIDVATEAFRQLDPDVRVMPYRRDGEYCEPGTPIVSYTGRAAAMLTAERTALNFVQRLSGIATLARRFVEAAGGQITILDTRKTTPLLRALEKYAVRAGGASNHRSRLDDAVLVKDNHIALGGGIASVVPRLRERHPGLRLEVEAQSLEQVDAALAAGVDAVLLDNLSTADIAEAVRRCRGRAETEISGGVTLDRLPDLAATGADYVSVGALTHSAPAADLSFDVEPA
jgi:nicotinate-nucleotide pyrophosphorylase (carboxylating)